MAMLSTTSLPVKQYSGTALLPTSTPAESAPVRDRRLAREQRSRPWLESQVTGPNVNPKPVTLAKSAKVGNPKPSTAVKTNIVKKMEVETKVKNTVVAGLKKKIEKKNVVKKITEAVKRVGGETKGVAKRVEKELISGARRTPGKVVQGQGALSANKNAGIRSKKATSSYSGVGQTKAGSGGVDSINQSSQSGWEQRKTEIDTRLKDFQSRALRFRGEDNSKLAYPSKPSSTSTSCRVQVFIDGKKVEPRVARKLPTASGIRGFKPGVKAPNHRGITAAGLKPCLKDPATIYYGQYFPSPDKPKKSVSWSKSPPQVSTFHVDGYNPAALRSCASQPRMRYVPPAKTAMFEVKYSTVRGGGRCVTHTAIRESDSGKQYMYSEMARIPRAMTLSPAFIHRYRAVRAYIKRITDKKTEPPQVAYGTRDYTLRLDLAENVRQKDIFASSSPGLPRLSGQLKTIDNVPWIVAKIHRGKSVPSMRSITSTHPYGLFTPISRNVKWVEYEWGLPKDNHALLSEACESEALRTAVELFAETSFNSETYYADLDSGDTSTRLEGSSRLTLQEAVTMYAEEPDDKDSYDADFEESIVESDGQPPHDLGPVKELLRLYQSLRKATP